jgi:hypothetical protein
VVNICTFLAVPFDHQFLKDKKYNQLSLANTAFPTPDGAILLTKQKNSHTIPMPSHPDAADAPSRRPHHLPVSSGCCDVVQCVLKSTAACVPSNPQSKTRVDLSAPLGCALASNNSVITHPRTAPTGVAGQGQQVVRFTNCRMVS